MNMYARILLIGPIPCGDASPAARLRDALRRRGHAVQLVRDPGERGGGSHPRTALEAALASFEPTVILWDMAIEPDDGTLSTLAGSACPKIAWCVTPGRAAAARDEGLFDVIAVCDPHAVEVDERGGSDGPRVLTAPPAIDVPYSNAGISRPGLARAGVTCSQAVAGDVRAELEGAAQAAGGAVVVLDPTSEGCLAEARPGADPAYWVRTTGFAVYFAGSGVAMAGGSAVVAGGGATVGGAAGDAPASVSAGAGADARDLDPMDMALRVAEGNIVLVEGGAGSFGAPAGVEAGASVALAAPVAARASGSDVPAGGAAGPVVASAPVASTPVASASVSAPDGPSDAPADASTDASGEGAVPKISLAGAIVPFVSGHLAEVVAGLVADAAVAERVLDAQRAALSHVSLGDVLDRVLHVAEAHAAMTGRHVLARRSPAVPVVVYGWLGAHNFGDDLLLSVVSDRIRRRFENAQIMVVGADPRALRCEEGVEAAAPHEKALLRDWLGFARAVVFVGGLIFDEPMAETAGDLEIFYDPWIEPSGQAAVSMLARLHGVPSVYLGIGTGPVDLPATRAAVRAIGLAGALMLPRDAGAREDLLTSGLDESQVRDAADLVLGARDHLLAIAEGAQSSVAPDRGLHARSELADSRLEAKPGAGSTVAGVSSQTGSMDDSVNAGAPAAAGSGCLLPADFVGRPYFIVSLRDWSLNPADFDERMAWLVDALVERTGAVAVFLPYDVDDVRIHERVAGLMEHADHVELLRERPEAQELLAWMGGEEFCLAMRLHCSIISNVLGRRSMGIDYNDKIGAYYRQMGQDDVLLPLAFTRDEATVAVDALEASPELRLGALADEVERRAKLVDAAYERLYGAIESARPAPERRPVYYPRLISRFEVDAIGQRRRAERAEAAADEARRAADAARSEADAARIALDVAHGDALALRESHSYRLGNALMKPLAALRRLFNHN